jgi:ABC-type polar amino acid transport system ATPase subunit
MIRISHLTKSYNATKVLDDVSLNIGRNEVVSIIGYSGSGKSTLLNCIAGLDSYDSGTVTTGIAKRNGYGGIGMVFNSGNLFPHLTVLRNLVLAPVKVLGISPEQAEEEAMRMLESVGIWSVRDAYPESLSSGQRQRAAIARSLMMKPAILLLDEPTSSLDPASTSEVFKVLSNLKNNDMTIVLVTHSIDLARSISDRIIFMSDGRICEQGTPSEIINHPQNRETKSFINHCTNLVYDIPSEKYDLPELNARIEVFCMRYRLPFSDTYALQLAVEELLNLIPLENGVNLVIVKSDRGLDVQAVLAKGAQPYLSQESIMNELGYTILEGLCEKIEEETNDLGESVIRLAIRQNSI